MTHREVASIAGSGRPTILAAEGDVCWAQKWTYVTSLDKEYLFLVDPSLFYGRLFRVSGDVGVSVRAGEVSVLLLRQLASSLPKRTDFRGTGLHLILCFAFVTRYSFSQR